MKYIFVLGLITLATAACGRVIPNCVNSTHNVSFSEGEQLLTEVLSKFTSREGGPYYKIVKVNSVAELRPVGAKDPEKDSLTVSINADLKDKNENKKNCYIGITGKPALENGYLVSFRCTGEEITFKFLNN